MRNKINVNRFDLGYQVGLAIEVVRILHGAIRISLTTNYPTLGTFKNGYLDYIENGKTYSDIRDSWINFGLTYCIKIVNESQFMINPISIKRKKKGLLKRVFTFSRL